MTPTRIREVLRNARYDVFFDAETESHTPACKFMAERKSRDGKRAIHVNVYNVGDTWSYSTWWFLGNGASPHETGRIGSEDDLRMVLEGPWEDVA